MNIPIAADDEEVGLVMMMMNVEEMIMSITMMMNE
jgi:hypothetical protein